MRLGLLIIASSIPALAAPCPMIKNHAVVLTPDQAAIADGGGIVVGTLPQIGEGDPDHGAAADWTLDKAKVTVKHIGPGLDVIAGAGALVDKDGKAIVTVKHGKPAELPPPGIASLERKDSRSKHPWTQTTASLSADPPATAVALVVLDKSGAARSWGRVTANAKSIAVFTSGGCATQPDGTTDSAANEEVRLVWLDASGRLSKPSAPIKVVGTSI
jgi:hypothetical protein